jgi:lipopolysaccharide transport system ATP-binding protein
VVAHHDADGEVLVRVQDVSKRFCRNLRRSLWYGVSDIMRDVSGLAASTSRLRREEFWALREVSLTVRRGECVGVIGHNGAGKSTLLKLLNGLIKPDRGRISIRGRVGALIELGAGFSPVLSGRENIFVNAAVLGIPRRQVADMVDDIIEFSGLGEFIEAPVQTYSSGMKVRLGFAIAAQMEPDVMLVDEVLAVGDPEFRSRCMDRIWELTRSGKVGFVFISHNMLAVDGLCQRILLLDRGVARTGPKAEQIARYFGDDVHMRYERLDPETRMELMTRSKLFAYQASGEIEIRSVSLTDGNGDTRDVFHPTDTLAIHVEYYSHRRLEKVISSVALFDASGLTLATERSVYHGAPAFATEGNGRLTIELDPIQLKAGKYVIGLAFQDPSLQSAYCLRGEDELQVVEDMPNPAGKEGFFSPRVAWILGQRRYTRTTDSS